MWNVVRGKNVLKVVWNTGGGKHQGSTKLLYMLSEITETHISHQKISLKIMYKIPKKSFFSEKRFIVTQKLKPISFTKIVYVTEPSYFHRNNFHMIFCQRNPLLSQKKSFFLEKFVCHGVKFLSKEKKVHKT